MSRSGYYEDTDDMWSHIRWRGAVASAIRGKRGQALLRDIAASMDAMPVKRLIARELELNGEVCALGTVKERCTRPVQEIDPEDYETVAAAFGVSEALVREIEYVNDECARWTQERGLKETPEERFVRVREWVAEQIEASEPLPVPAPRSGPG